MKKKIQFQEMTVSGAGVQESMGTGVSTLWSTDVTLTVYLMALGAPAWICCPHHWPATDLQIIT